MCVLVPGVVPVFWPEHIIPYSIQVSEKELDGTRKNRVELASVAIMCCCCVSSSENHAVTENPNPTIIEQ